MSRRLNLPDTASVANSDEQGRLHAPSAERNAGAIADLVADFGPAQGRALEIASGTGQHAVTISARLPDLIWQPTDIDPLRLESIRAWAADHDLPNLQAPHILDATQPGWGKTHHGQNLILLVNLLHLISWEETTCLIEEAAKALASGGVLILYGPFMRAGELTSDGDRKFHASLQAQDPEIGYKDDFDILDTAVSAGLEVVCAVEMPANNLSLILKRPD